MVEEFQPVRLGPADLEQLIALERLCFSYPWTEEQFRIGLEGEVFKVFGIKHAGRVVAYLSFYQMAGEMEVLNLAVDPGYRRRGLGKRLLGLVLQTCYKLDVRESFLEVRKSNVAALSLYGLFGFELVGERKGYYPDNGEDALVLKCDLKRLFELIPETKP